MKLSGILSILLQAAAIRRSRLCVVKTYGDGITDDSDNILSAFHGCNNGGHVLFPRGKVYVIGTAMDWTFLKHIDIDIQGRIRFTNDTAYWQAHSFRFIFQNVTSFFKLGGEDVWIYGGGTLDGNGQVWYDTYAANAYTLRPVLVGIDGLKDSVLSDLVLRHSPQYYHFVANASNIVFNNISIAGDSTSKNTAKNTDGWDTYRSRDVTIMNSVVNNADDCISFKPNSTDILVQSLFCAGSHGISVGSLGQYVGEFDIVESIMVSNVSMHNASDGARIKVWPNTASAMSSDLQGGGGSGSVRNITYEDMLIDNVDYAIEITQCYGQRNLALCQQYPSSLTIENIVFRRFKGRTSAKYRPLIAAFACSSAKVCSNIHATDINVVSPGGTRQAYCLNQQETNLDADCTNNYKGFN
ncbi:exopolygalacturonase [Lasiosphaeria miniovina]|uniref:galacturonan 1,4-alpha-galacturonidase n=1 Tax=Lasiosphaeria miniovina TaxID=1954250 RepID=A0AA40EF36_9PEZI|nr:exopolygalacturonase [Lasiosphaeria miniovina]KAK0735186.1 exopolygalacturonase [Lasiosphaeria miniovina]